MYVARPLRIGVTLPPYYSLVREIVRRYAEVVVLDEATYGDPEELSPEALDTLKGVDVLIYEGMGDDDYILKTLEAHDLVRKTMVASMSENFYIVPPPGAQEAGVPTRPYLSIGNTTQQLYAIANSLLQFDPANSMAYRLNTRDYAMQLRTLKAVYSEALYDLPPATVPCVTLGGGFDLLLGEFDVEVKEVFAQPDPLTPAAVTNLAEAIAGTGAKVVFSAAPLDDSMQSALADATGCVVRNMTTMLDAPFAQGTFEAGMRQNLQAITEAVRAANGAPPLPEAQS
jgi:zinc transport system substrate-binding protein